MHSHRRIGQVEIRWRKLEVARSGSRRVPPGSGDQLYRRSPFLEGGRAALGDSLSRILRMVLTGPTHRDEGDAAADDRTPALITVGARCAAHRRQGSGAKVIGRAPFVMERRLGRRRRLGTGEISQESGMV